METCVDTGSSGFFSRTFTYDEVWKHGTKRYFLHVEATHPNTNKTVTLIGSFRVFGHQEKYFCSFNMINTGTKLLPQQGSLEFIRVGSAQNFTCKIGKDMHSCMSMGN